MSELYTYNGQNLTTAIRLKTEKVAELMAEREGRSFDDCLETFLSSKTYKTLQTPSTLLWGENAEYILDDYYRELGKG